MKQKIFKTKRIFKIGLLLLFFLVLLPNVLAQDYTSTSFILRDPVVTVSGGYATSTSFAYYSSTGQTVAGEATSTSFTLRSGFLYYPEATSPVLTATAGNGQVSLSWTAAVATLANITDYQWGISTATGGPYTYTSVGTARSATKTDLTNGTIYYFKVKAYAGTLFLAISDYASATPTSPTTPTCGNGSCSGGETCSTCPADCGQCGGGGGGGGGGGATLPPAVVTKVNFSGRAYPKSTVTLLKDAQTVATTIAGADANFQISTSNLAGGNYIFAIFSEDKDGRRSSLLTFPVSVVSNATTNVSGIFIAPTITVDKSEVKRGDDITIFGQSAPQADIVISVSSDEEFFSKTISDKNGIYLYNFDTTVLEYGSHHTKSKASIGNQEISGYSYLVNFKVGTENVSKEVSTEGPIKGNVNNDDRVNLIDFSIVAYWYRRPSPPANVDLNNDKKVDLVDFSIMAYYWTG